LSLWFTRVFRTTEVCGFAFTFDRPVERSEELFDRESELETLRRTIKSFAITDVTGFRELGRRHSLKQLPMLCHVFILMLKSSSLSST